jgi:Lon protease-like protein
MTGDGEVASDALEALAIFPLPGAVLFPHALLPLHVFEPRYREMIADVLAGARLLAVARIEPGHEAEAPGNPDVCRTAGVGACIAHERLPDGRYNVVLRGLGRIFIEEEHDLGRSYRQVRARRLIDTRSSRASDVPVGHAQLIVMCDRLAERDGARALSQLARTVTSPGGCADLIASALVRDPDERQRLLELLIPPTASTWSPRTSRP